MMWMWMPMHFPVTHVVLRTPQLRIDSLICVIQNVPWQLERKSYTSAAEAWLCNCLSFHYRSLQVYAAVMHFPVTHVVLRTPQQIYIHSERSELCPLTFESSSPWDSERGELCPLTLESSNPQALRAKRAVSMDHRICKSTSIATEASCANGPSNLQNHGYKERLGLCACGFADSRVHCHNSLRSQYLWVCILKRHWAQLASLAVLVDSQIQGSMGTACFARYACRFANSRANRRSSLRSLCLWTCGFKHQ